MRNGLIAAGLFLLTLLAYSPLTMVRILNQNDNFWYVPTAMSVLSEGNIDLQEFEQPVQELAEDMSFLRSYFGEDDYRIFRTDDGRVLNHYPIGGSLACVPLVAILTLRYNAAEQNPIWTAMAMALDIAKIYAAGCVGLFFLVLRRLKTSIGWSIGLSLVLAFASLNFGQHAGGLWSHNPAAFYVMLALLFVVGDKSKYAYLAAFPLVFAVTMRPDVILLIAVLTVYIWFHQRKAFLAYAAIGATGAAMYVTFCQLNFGEFTQPYPGPVQVLGRDFAGGLPGLLLSPSRGLFIFMPVCLFSVWGMIEAFRRVKTPVIYRYLSVALIVHWLFLAVWPMWWAGWSYGPRLFCTMIPIWLILIVPMRTALRRIPIALAGLACVSWSVFAEVRCISDQDVHLWNAMPVDVNDHTQRLWDWGDMQILRGLGGDYGVDLPRKSKPEDFH